MTLVVVAWCSSAFGEGGSRVDEAVYAELADRGSACVWVVLEPATSSTAGEDLLVRDLPAGGFALRYRYRFAPALVLEVRDRGVLDLLERRSDVRRVRLDAAGSGALLESRALIGADALFEDGITGDGTVVAVLDTGVDAAHPDLEDAVIHRWHFLDAGSTTGEGAEDDHGHGTHVAGIIAGRGGVAPRGVAPGARVAAIKVLDENNRGFFSDWTAGVEHVVALHEADNGIRIDAINLSVQSDVPFEGVCDDLFAAFSAAFEAAIERGITVFAASGNGGSTRAIALPACYSSAISVGSSSVDPPDRISAFTNRTPILDVLAPGEAITAAALGGGSETRTGTSQSCAHVTAVACLLREIAPDLSPARLRALLRATGTPVFDARLGSTFPRVDALAAATALADFDDCNDNGTPDLFDIVDGTSRDCDADGVPDECEGAPGPPGGLCPTLFHRGDPNNDGRLDIADPVFTLNSLFLGGPPAECAESADSNNDASIDVSDAVLLIGYLLLGRAPPASPGPPGTPCGWDTDEPDSPGDLGCESAIGCE